MSPVSDPEQARPRPSPTRPSPRGATAQLTELKITTGYFKAASGYHSGLPSSCQRSSGLCHGRRRGHPLDEMAGNPNFHAGVRVFQRQEIRSHLHHLGPGLFGRRIESWKQPFSRSACWIVCPACNCLLRSAIIAFPFEKRISDNRSDPWTPAADKGTQGA